jgi:hypothetical protein
MAPDPNELEREVLPPVEIMEYEGAVIAENVARDRVLVGGCFTSAV